MEGGGIGVFWWKCLKCHMCEDIKLARFKDFVQIFEIIYLQNETLINTHFAQFIF